MKSAPFRLLPLLLCALLAAGCGQPPAPRPAGHQPSPSAPAYPPPAPWSPQPTVPPLPTITPPPSPEPSPTPLPAKRSPKPTQPVTPILPFPTPDVPPTPAGDPPAELGAIWYPYREIACGPTMLQAVLVDGQGTPWGKHELAIDVAAEFGVYGSMVYNLHLSGDGTSFVADVGSRDNYLSYWIDPATGERRPISTDREHEDFLAWGPDHQIFAWDSIYHENVEDIWLVDLDSQEHRVFTFPAAELGSYLGAVATSPDGLLLADVVVYGARSNSRISIGLQPLEGGFYIPIATYHTPNSADVLVHHLVWSPDGQQIVLTVITGTVGINLSDDNFQLWLVDRHHGEKQVLTHGLFIHHPVAWSPDGRYIAFIKSENPFDWRAISNLWLYDLVTRSQIQVTHFDQYQVTAMAWSPDGQRLAFALTMGDYGEVWITTLDGSEQYPVAGPTTPFAPIVWQPAAPGE